MTKHEGMTRPFFVIPSEVEESLTGFSYEIRDVSTALDMRKRAVEDANDEA
jgi:hypothetical protein